jgi:post-segregation antitoxin (ccd killing protein)
MTTSRVTITLPEELRQAVADAAERAGLPFSAVVTDALAAWARGQLVDTWLVEYQAEHGEFSEEELKALAQDAGIPYIPAEPGRSTRTDPTAA